jgi:hypothetical protein
MTATTAPTLDLGELQTAPSAPDPSGSQLFAPEPGRFSPIGRAEARAIATLEELHGRAAFTPAQQLLAETARSLAQNIDAGNRKGRAIGNEAMQLAAIVEQLMGDGVDVEGEGELPDELAAIVAAMATPPRQPGA